MNQPVHRPSDNPSRRSSDRYPLNADVEVLEPLNTSGVVINVCDGGLRIAVSKELPVGAVCVLAVRVDEGETVEIARVAWSRQYADGYLVGVSFVDDL
ncbi:MAG: PilZ domain-containing protein [Deltaproteobacteria bacterium]|nr:PilZ domain-containing protein [Deltaproteobacteria bacterium]